MKDNTDQKVNCKNCRHPCSNSGKNIVQLNCNYYDEDMLE